jgi:hypothetical protein
MMSTCNVVARRLIPLFAILLPAVILWPRAARTADEIQVYNGEIAKVGRFTLQQHLNYAFKGRKEPDFPGGLVPHRALNGTPELAYGVTDWYEIGFYAPFAMNSDNQFLSNGFKIRHLFVTPNAEQRSFFYGVNFEFGYTTPRFSDTRYTIEIRPIIGWRHGDYEFIVNPIIDIGLGNAGEITFAPAARLARKIGKESMLGLEYYSDFGAFGGFAAPDNQLHALFAVTDFKLGELDLNLGIGYGMTNGSDRLVAKMIVGRDL